MIVLLGGPADGRLLDTSYPGYPAAFLGRVIWQHGAERHTYYGSFREGPHEYYVHESEVTADR